MFALYAVALPVGLTCALFDISLIDATLINCLTRITATFHSAALINSAAHLFGERTYAPTIRPGDFKWIGWATVGEGMHNYHHAWPGDYTSGEDWLPFNISKMVIDFASIFGMTYDRKTTSKQMLAARLQRVADQLNNNNEKCL